MYISKKKDKRRHLHLHYNLSIVVYRTNLDHLDFLANALSVWCYCGAILIYLSRITLLKQHKKKF